jgi:GalNAc-alpha-(1->4)-GalNAc-alpha-(1->3)-diNAcBac-PP-undecaprenol alpha-1,4-N-acetyl-D-galactosaminyltransferase
MMMKLCFISPTLNVGGAERVISILLKSLSEKGFNVSLLLYKNQIVYKIPDDVDVFLPSFRKKNKILYIIKLFFYVRSTILSLKPDFVLSFQERYNPINIFALINSNVRVIVFDRSNPFLKQSIFKSLLKRISYPLADSFVVQTDIAREFYINKKINNIIRTIPNPISPINVNYQGIDSKTLIFIGRLIPTKNLDFLIHVFYEINRMDWKLKIIGSGPLKSHLIHLVKTLYLCNNVLFLDYVKDVQFELSTSTIMVFPSLSEGFPNALLEAMGVGVPCISFDCMTGPRELIRDNINGFLIDVNDKYMLKKKLLMLMNDRKLRVNFSENAKLVREYYSVEKIVEQYLNLFSFLK